MQDMRPRARIVGMSATPSLLCNLLLSPRVSQLLISVPDGEGHVHASSEHLTAVDQSWKLIQVNHRWMLQ